MSSKRWAYMSGPLDMPSAGSAFNPAAFSASYGPSGAAGGCLWVDSRGNPWIYGGISAAGRSSALWLFSIAKLQYSLTPGSPMTWETTPATNPIWPSAVAHARCWPSAFDPDLFYYTGGSDRGSGSGSGGLSASVYQVRTLFGYSAAPPVDPSPVEPMDSSRGINVTFYNLPSGLQSISGSTFANGSAASGAIVDSNVYVLRNDLGFSFIPSGSNLIRANGSAWGMRAEGFLYNPDSTATQFKFRIRSSGAILLEWGQATTQTLLSAGETVPNSAHDVADFNSGPFLERPSFVLLFLSTFGAATLTAVPGYNFFRVSFVELGNSNFSSRGSVLIAGISNTDGNGYLPLLSRSVRQSAPARFQRSRFLQLYSSPPLDSTAAAWVKSRIASALSIRFEDLTVNSSGVVAKRGVGFPAGVTFLGAAATDVFDLISDGWAALLAQLNTNPYGITLSLTSTLPDSPGATGPVPPSNLLPQSVGPPSESFPPDGSGVQGSSTAGIVAAVVVIVVLVIAAAIGGFFLWRHRQKHSKDGSGRSTEMSGSNYGNTIAPSAKEDKFNKPKKPKNPKDEQTKSAKVRKPKKNEAVPASVGGDFEEQDRADEEAERNPVPVMTEAVFSTAEFKEEWLIPFVRPLVLSHHFSGRQCLTIFRRTRLRLKGSSALVPLAWSTLEATTIPKLRSSKRI